MDNFDIYNDIAKRTNGDIYVGVVGPVRTGKSTFISKFMQTSVIENIKNEYEKQRAIDEMPQSGAGKTIMTTQPKFIPSEAVTVSFSEKATAKIRLVDCVGYVTDGANGFVEDGMPRMVKTMWSENEIPFEEAAEIGTHKVISEHSTIAVLVTTDGSISNIDRHSYEKAEERVVQDLKTCDKPFVIVLNTKNPNSTETIELGKNLEKKYQVPVLVYDVLNIGKDDISNIIKEILMEFPVKEIDFNLPKWIRALPASDEFVKNILNKVKQKSTDVFKMNNYKNYLDLFENDSDFKDLEVSKIDLSKGILKFDVLAEENLFYKTLGKELEADIDDDFGLFMMMKDLAKARREYDKLKVALETATQTGYGIVCPNIDDLTLMEPEIVTKGGNSSIKLRAKAPSLHIMKVDVEAEICPAIGNTETGSLASFMLNEIENNKQEIWNKNMFGKPMNELVKDSINTKLANLPDDVQVKMRKTITKIVNERKGGVICILL